MLGHIINFELFAIVCVRVYIINCSYSKLTLNFSSKTHNIYYN